MSISFPPSRNFRSDLQPALEWLESLGIDYKPTRFGKYGRDLLAEARKEAQLDAYDSAIEAHDLIMIHKGLASTAGDLFVQKLRQFTSGPAHSKYETVNGASLTARNIGLELLIASHFALGGFPIRFSSEADVEFTDKDYSFFVECKRPLKYGTVKKNLDGAYRQLRRRYNASESPELTRGFVVLSISKFANPESKTVGPLTYDEYADISKSLLSRFLEENRSVWKRSIHPNTMAVFGYIQIAVYMPEKPGTLIHRQFDAMYVRPGHEADIKYGDPDRVYLKQIVDRLNQGARTAFSR